MFFFLGGGVKIFEVRGVKTVDADAPCMLKISPTPPPLVPYYPRFLDPLYYNKYLIQTELVNFIINVGTINILNWHLIIVYVE